MIQRAITMLGDLFVVEGLERWIIAAILMGIIEELAIIVTSGQAICERSAQVYMGQAKGAAFYLQNSTDTILWTVSPSLTVATGEAAVMTHKNTSLLTLIRPRVPCTPNKWRGLYSDKSTLPSALNSTIHRGGVDLETEL